MVVWPRIMIDSIVDLGIRVPGSFCAKLPDRPFGAMFGVEEFDEL